MIKTGAKKKLNSADSYFRLVREFPLRPLRNEAELEAANAVVIGLLAGKAEEEMDAGERDYLDALTLLIKEAERAGLEAIIRRSSPVRLLKHLMHESSMTVNDLGKVIGSQPAASLLLSGKRSISKPQVRKLADYFGLSPAAFID